MFLSFNNTVLRAPAHSTSENRIVFQLCMRLIRPSAALLQSRRANMDGVRHAMLFTSLLITRKHSNFLLNNIAPFALFVALSFLSISPTARRVGPLRPSV